LVQAIKQDLSEFVLFEGFTKGSYGMRIRLPIQLPEIVCTTGDTSKLLVSGEIGPRPKIARTSLQMCLYKTIC
jgi:hypothetical protein